MTADMFAQIAPVAPLVQPLAAAVVAPSYELGDVFESPWGRYAVWCLEPFVLLSLDRVAWIQPPDGKPNERMRLTGERVPVPPCFGRGGTLKKDSAPPPRDDGAGTPCTVGTRAEVSLAEPQAAATQFGDPNLTLGGMRPGNILCVVPTIEQKWWRPCLTRSYEGGREHCWFIAATSDGTGYCWDCRPKKPRVMIVKKEGYAETTDRRDHHHDSTPPMGTAIPPYRGGPHVVGSAWGDQSRGVQAPDRRGGGSEDRQGVRVALEAAPYRHVEPDDSVQPQKDPATPTTKAKESDTAQGSAAAPPISAPAASVAASTPAPPSRVPPAPDPKRDVGSFASAPRPTYRPMSLAAWKEECAERAAILEYLAGYPRAQAEQIARTLVGPAPRAA